VRIGNRFLIPLSEVDRLRGDLAAPSFGESPWDFAKDAPGAVLPRASQSADVATGPVLGG
jgi:hypothetical protein